MSGQPEEDLAQTAKWAATCKDCRTERAAAERAGQAFKRGSGDLSKLQFDYPDAAAAKVLERGGSRSDRCPECRKKHRTKIAAFPVAYVDIAAIGEAREEDGSGPSGPLGGLGPLPVLHKRDVATVNLKKFQMGLSADDMIDLLDQMADNQVVVLEAGTGTGKSTVGPFRLMNPPAGASLRPTDLGPIVVTQPRVPATTEIAKFVGESMCFDHDSANCTKHIGPGYPVGYQCDGQKVWDESCQLIYVTDGTLINWITNGDLVRYSTIIIDEAHERSANIDTILVLLHANLHRYPQLRVVIASATIDPNFFVEFFSDVADGVAVKTVEAVKSIGYGVPLFPGEPLEEVLADGLEIDGQKYKGWESDRTEESDHRDLRAETGTLLKLRAEPMASLKGWNARKAAKASAEQAMRIIEAVVSRQVPQGDIIAFLPSKASCLIARDLVRQAVEEADLPVDAYWLMKETEEKEKKLAMAECKPGRFKVVFASNLAETSLTIAGLRYVVDSGLINQATWDPITASQAVPTVMHSRSGVRQRWGRVGRKTYGWVFPLYSKQQFLEMAKDTPAGSTQVNLQEVMLKLAAAGVDDLGAVKFPANFPTARDEFAQVSAAAFTAEVKRATQSLKVAGALTSGGDLTAFGEELNRSRVSAERTVALLFADRLACVPETAVALCMLDSGPLAGWRRLMRSSNQWSAVLNLHARRCHEALAVGCSDDLDLALRIFSDWEASPEPEEWAKQWWLDHDVLLAIQADAKKLIDAMAPSMSREARRPLDLRLAVRARAAISRGLSNFTYGSNDSGMWFPPDSSDLERALVLPQYPLLPPEGQVIALARGLPLPERGMSHPRSTMWTWVKLVDWAVEGLPDPFTLMRRARLRQRSKDGELSTAFDKTTSLRSFLPIGTRITVGVEADPSGQYRIISCRPVGYENRYAGVDADIEVKVADEETVDEFTPDLIVYSTSSSSTETEGDFRIAIPKVAGAQLPPEDEQALALRVDDLECNDVSGKETVVYSETLDAKARDVFDESSVIGALISSRLSLAAGVNATLEATVAGYELAHDAAEATVIVDRVVFGSNKGQGETKWTEGDSLTVRAGSLVHDHFRSYRQLQTVEPDGGVLVSRADFLYGGPFLDESIMSGDAIYEGSDWNATIIDGSKIRLLPQYEGVVVSLLEDMHARLAARYGLVSAVNLNGPDRVRVLGVLDVAPVSNFNLESCWTVSLPGDVNLGFEPRFLVHIPEPRLASSYRTGDTVSIELAVAVGGRKSGKWEPKVVERILRTSSVFKKEAKDIHFGLTNAAPLPSAALGLLIDEARGDAERLAAAWNLWSTSHHLTAWGRRSLRLVGAGQLSPALAVTIERSGQAKQIGKQFGVEVRLDLEGGSVEIRGDEPQAVNAALIELSVSTSRRLAVFHLPGHLTPKAVAPVVTAAESIPGLIAVQYHPGKHELHAIAEEARVNTELESRLREISDRHVVSMRFSALPAMLAFQKREVKAALLNESGCLSATISSGANLQWVVTSRTESEWHALSRLLAARGMPHAVLSQESSVLTVENTSGTAAITLLPERDGEPTGSSDIRTLDPHTNGAELLALEVEGDNIETAVSEGIVRLGVAPSAVGFTVIDEGKRSWLGTVKRPARVRVFVWCAVEES